MNAQAPQVDDSERPRAELPRGAIKFTYPSGARPLEGYTLKRGVGRGGFGEVYFATSDAGKEVALKLIRRNLDVEIRGVTQCLNLKHPNLIALYDIRTDEMGDQWVVMEYVSGESLEEVIDRSPNGLPVEQVLWWMRGLCAGVAYLHDHGIVHRDLKPGNIFSDEGTVKIGDYGLAKFISCSRRSGQTESVGTVHYMAPEIANGRYGREIDTYALGIILFEMLTGHVPFEGESVGEVLMKHLTAEPDLNALNEPYREIVKRALAKDPNARIKSVGELVTLLPAVPGQPTTFFADPDMNVRQRPEPAVGAAAQSQPKAAASDDVFAHADAMAKDGWNHATRLVGDAGKRVFQTAYGSDSPEEPIWKTVRNGLAYVRKRWRGDGVPELSGIQKVILIVAAVWLCSAVSGALVSRDGSSLPLLLQILLIYGIYYVVWVSFIRPGLAKDQPHQPGSSPATPPKVYTVPAAASAEAQQTAAWKGASAESAPSISRYEEKQRRRRARTNWRELVNQQLIAKSHRQKFTELLGSMLVAAICAATASLAIPLLTNSPQNSEIFAAYLWLCIVGTLGSWAVLVPSKFVEGKLEDQVPMRITLMLLGALVGIAAWFVAESLFVRMPGMHEPVDVGSGLISHQMLNWPRITDGSNPRCAVYMAYFSFLFLMPRWWRETEYTRSSRLSLWCVCVCVFWAWVLHVFWWFPQPIGMIVAAVISLSTQLASPWMPPSQRRALSEASKQAVIS